MKPAASGTEPVAQTYSGMPTAIITRIGTMPPPRKPDSAPAGTRTVISAASRMPITSARPMSRGSTPNPYDDHPPQTRRPVRRSVRRRHGAGTSRYRRERAHQAATEQAGDQRDQCRAQDREERPQDRAGHGDRIDAQSAASRAGTTWSRPGSPRGAATTPPPGSRRRNTAATARPAARRARSAPSRGRRGAVRATPATRRRTAARPSGNRVAGRAPSAQSGSRW